MQVILKKDIPELGRMGEIVKVRDGYARNFLIPKALVLAADPVNLKRLEHQKRLVDAHKKKAQASSHEVAKTLKEVEIVIQRRFNEAGKMFGSISTADLSTQFKEKGFTVDRRDIELETIKGAGTTPMKIRLPGDVFVDLKLTVEALPEKTITETKKAVKAKAPRAKKAAKTEDASE